MKEKKILPSGFSDLIFEEAEQNYRNINSILDLFLKQDFRLIKTPLVEFGDDNNQNSFFISDVVTGKNLVIRSDITLQISRLLNTRLANAKLPLKLCYAGDVVRAKSEGLNNSRQSTQIGVEIIGCDKEKSDLEIIRITLEAISKLNLQDILIEISLPDFLEMFLSELKVKENKDELKAAILGKNISKIQEFGKKNAALLTKIAMNNSSINELAKDILSKTKNKEIAFELKKIEEIESYLAQNFSEIKICFDLFGDNKSSYHNKISFDIFSSRLPAPIAKGGRYKINDLEAIGATIYMDRL